jgi:hypothetical protein
LHPTQEPGRGKGFFLLIFLEFDVRFVLKTLP